MRSLVATPLGILALASILTGTVASDAAAQTPPIKPLTLDQTAGRGGRVDFSGRVPRWRWNEAGTHVEIPGEPEWLDPENGERVPATRSEAAPSFAALLVAAQRKTDGLKELDAQRVGRLPRVRSDDGTRHLFRWDDSWWSLRGDGQTAKSAEARQLDFDFRPQRSLFDLSPDGRWCAGVEEYNFVLLDLDRNARHDLSTDGSKERFRYGMLDWVYQEEVYGRGNFRAFWWSPNSTHVSYLKLDESGVPTFTVVDHLPHAGEVEVTSYPKAGAINPRVSLWVCAVGEEPRDPVKVDLSAYASDILIVRVGWSPNGDQLVVQVQDRIQTWLDLLFVDPNTGRPRRVLREQSTGWTNVLGDPHWLEDGSFLWRSERTGYQHLYRYSPDGRRNVPVTKGEWQVRRVLRVDEERGRIWFTGTRDGAANDHTYRIGLDGSGLRRLTHGDGTHRVTLSHDGAHFIDRYSSYTVPTQVRLCNGDGTRVEVLAAAEPRDAQAYGYRVPEKLSIPAADGYLMDAMLITPPDYDPNRRYPVWLSTYSGPNSPTVRNRWQTSTFDQFLAQQGMLVFKVNNRSSSGRGQLHSAACARDLGASELSDLVDALAWLGANRGADLARVGITGWSYGGFMAAYALTHSQAFRLGVAGAGVYDWRNYDTIYTERYMATPKENPEGYRRSSCVEAAGELHGHLVIVHGTMDDNVHLSNAMQLVHALQQNADASFELMVYPRSRHGLRSSDQRWHLRQLTWRAIERELLGDDDPAAASSR